MKKLRKPTSLDNLFNDLFRQYKSNPDIMKNPHNIEWILRKYPSLHSKNIAELKECIEKSEPFYCSNDVREVLKDPINVIARMKDLISQGLDIKEKTYIVARQRSLPVLQAAIELGADINYQNKNGKTALRLALLFRSKDTINWLWSHPQLDKFIKDGDGLSYAMSATVYKNKEITGYFLKHYPDEFLYKKSDGKNILHLIRSTYSEKNNSEIENRLIAYLVINHNHLLYERDKKGILAIDNAQIDFNQYLIEKRYIDLQSTLKETSGKVVKTKI